MFGDASAMYCKISTRSLRPLKRILITGCNVGRFQWYFFRIFEIFILCFVVAICDLVHALEAMYGLP